MQRLHILGIVLFTISIMSSSYAQSIEDVPYRVQRLSERVIVINDEWSESPNLVTAVASEKGVIVIDTQVSQSFALKTRGLIEKIFGRNDFLYIINTHDDKDHTGGNQVYSDADIIAHEECLETLSARRTRGLSTAWNERYIEQQKAVMAKEDIPPERAETIRKDIAARLIHIQDLKGGHVVTLPTITFRDRLTLHLGDMTLELIFYGSGGHSGSDIIIHIPQEKILCMGDLCGPWGLGLSVSDNFQWHNIIDSIIQEKDSFETVICGHMNTLSRELFLGKFAYMKHIKQKLETAMAKGHDLEWARQNITIDTTTPNYKSTLEAARAIGEGHDFLKMLHEECIQDMWQKMHKPAAAEIEKATIDFPVLKGPYLGQKPPGKKPEIFAPGIVSTESEEFGCSFSPDGTEIYFTRTLTDAQKQQKRMTVMVTRLDESGWTKPKIAPFCDKNYNEGEPNLSQDGNIILYGRLLQSEDGSEDPRIIIAERKKNGWSEPVNLMHGMFATMTDDNIIYYTDISQGYSKGDIYRVRYSHGGHHSPEKLNGKINSPQQDAHPFVTPGGELLIFDSNRPGGFGDNDLYICFRQENGNWSDPVNMGTSVNTQEYEAIPCLTHDGKYLFFFRNGDIYWICARFIEDLKNW